MANITASMVKELREMTGAGMMDCKKALNETDGDMDAAVEFLRKSGAAKAEKKASRIAAEGICRIACGNGAAVVAEVNSETDFVAKNEVFQEFVQKVADTALESGLAGGKNGEDIEALMDKNGLKDLLVEKTAKIGEKLSVRRFERIEGTSVATYIHGGGRIGVLVAADGVSGADIDEALNNIAMQVAAMNPEYNSRSDISAENLAKEKEITIDSALNDPASLPKPILNELFAKAVEGKVLSDEDLAIYEEKKNDKYLFNFLSEEAKQKLAGLAMEGKDKYVGDKIFSGLVEGRISKHLKDICLMDQIYVKAEDGKQSVAKYLESVNKDLKITKFIRFEVGEGMEKKNEDFAAEVAAQMAGN
ncbi:MAG: translation elongation factor Ts [Lachnospiraceae bacterium]|nr:translation elongation factor Ts [Lachnospiraceae bacterium]